MAWKGRKKMDSAKQRQIVYTYLMNNRNMAKTARIEGVSRETIQSWKRTDPEWWESIEAEVWLEIEEKFKRGYRETIELSMKEIHDRIKNGDTYRDPKTGEYYQVPVKARELATVAGIAQDKLNVARGKPTSISGSADVSAKQRIEELRALVADSPNVVPMPKKESA